MITMASSIDPSGNFRRSRKKRKSRSRHDSQFSTHHHQNGTAESSSDSGSEDSSSFAERKIFATVRSSFSFGSDPSQKENGDAIASPISKDKRLVVVRYFLDRPGFDLRNSAARFWFDPPKKCTPHDIRIFLTNQGIALDGLLIELYLDKFQSFMMLAACEASLVQWNFAEATLHEPGVINVRLTDLKHAEYEEQYGDLSMSMSGHTSGNSVAGKMIKTSAPPQAQQSQQMANTIPAGLLSFSMMVGMETIGLIGKMYPGAVSMSFSLVWGPYMVFVGGMLQTIVGILQVLRSNIYGAIAFLGFGSFWFANGVTLILEKYFAVEGNAADELVGISDPVGTFLRVLYIFAFSCVLLKQTLVMNKLSTTLIALLCLKLAFQGLAQWWKAARYGQLIFGWATSIFAFYVFTTEFTNNVYHREVMPVYKWSEKTSPEEVFGATGRVGTLHSKAARLRRASYPTRYKVRAAEDVSIRNGQKFH